MGRYFFRPYKNAISSSVCMLPKWSQYIYTQSTNISFFFLSLYFVYIKHEIILIINFFVSKNINKEELRRRNSDIYKVRERDRNQKKY